MKANASNTAEFLARKTKRRILITIRENSEISRLEIARLTGLSTATVTRVVDSLMNDEDLVEERGNISLPKGRPRKPLHFKGRDKYIIGIDLGTTSIRGVLSDLNLESIKEIEIVTEAHKGYEHVLSRVVEVVHSLQNTSLIDSSKILGVGLAVAGLINTSNESVEYSPAFGWNDIKVKQILQKEIALPLFYDNVSRLMALGELQFGKGRNYQNFVTINAGYGIGAGIIFKKKLFYGTDGMAGEFGHLPVCGDKMVTCACGKTSCLSAYSSGDAIARRAVIKMEQGQNSILSGLSGGEMDQISAEMVARAYEQGDRLAQDVFDEGMEHLGSAIAGLINILNPEAIFIGGGLSLNGSVFWDKLVHVVNENVLVKRGQPYV